MKRLLFVTKGAESASSRYRALQYFSRWRAAGFEPSHISPSGGAAAVAAMLKAAAASDIVIVVRKTFPAPLLWLLRRASRRLLFDFDDAIFCNTDGSPSATRMARFGAMVRACDRVLAGNRYLADEAARFTAHVTVVPTCIEPGNYPDKLARDDGDTELVWIGSSSTRKYLDEALPWLAQAAVAVAGLRLKVVADFAPACPGLAVLPVSWRADSETRELALADIGIAPMRDDDWTRGKCALKVLQYMAAGLPVISSDAGANREIVLPEETGLLVATPSEWIDAIARLAAQPALRQAIGQAGRSRARREYSLDAGFARQCAAVEALF